MTVNKASSRLTICLAVSVAINLLLIGGLIGRGLAPQAGPSGITSASLTGEDGGRLARKGRSAERRAARAKLREAWQATASVREELETARTSLGAHLKATPYDEAAVSQAFADMRAAETRLQAATHAYLAPILTQTPPEHRAALANLMLKRAPRRRARRSRDD